MDYSRLGIVVCSTLLIVVIINLVIYYSIVGKKGASDTKIFSKLLEQGRNPWKTELLRMEELARRVAELKAGEATAEKTEPGPEKDAHEG